MDIVGFTLPDVSCIGMFFFMYAFHCVKVLFYIVLF